MQEKKRPARDLCCLLSIFPFPGAFLRGTSVKVIPTFARRERCRYPEVRSAEYARQVVIKGKPHEADKHCNPETLGDELRLLRDRSALNKLDKVIH